MKIPCYSTRWVQIYTTFYKYGGKIRQMSFCLILSPPLFFVFNGNVAVFYFMCCVAQWRQTSAELHCLTEYILSLSLYIKTLRSYFFAHLQFYINVLIKEISILITSIIWPSDFKHTELCYCTKQMTHTSLRKWVSLIWFWYDFNRVFIPWVNTTQNVRWQCLSCCQVIFYAIYELYYKKRVWGRCIICQNKR